MPGSANNSFQNDVQSVHGWMTSSRFTELTRLYSARQVVEQRGRIRQDHTVARVAAEGFYALLRELFSSGRAITTFGPYSPGQAVAMKRAGIEGIYLGGWATSAKGSLHEDPGPDLASYPLSTVPDEAAALVRALLTADKNQRFARSRMTLSGREMTPEVDFSPFIIADADTGHGGDAHVRNLIRRFVEAGVPGYHIEDQKPGAKKCGHQGGKVLVPCDEQIKRLNAARFQLDVMGVAGVIVARTDAESATLLDGDSDERDQPYILGATQRGAPSYKTVYLAALRLLTEAGVEGVNGHDLYAVSAHRHAEAVTWLERTGMGEIIREAAAKYHVSAGMQADRAVDSVMDVLVDLWQRAVGLTTYGQAVADHMASWEAEGHPIPISISEWLDLARISDTSTAKARALELGFDVAWDPELARTPEGYHQVQGGIPYAVAKSLAVAPFSDLLWMETKTADLDDARQFAEAIHAVYPDKMLAYNLSPSFNWDTTGMTEQEMQDFPAQLARLGYVFNFITYGGHQVDGMAGEQFAAALQEEGMLALAKLQRRLRLTDSPYRTPQTLVGGPRLDAGLMASSGRTATTRAMGKGSTQFQHLVQTETPTGNLEDWLAVWVAHHGLDARLRVRLRPYSAVSELLELAVFNRQEKVANLVFTTLRDRRGREFMSVRDQNTLMRQMRRKRLMSLLHLFLIKRYKPVKVHYLTPSDDNRHQTARMKEMGIFRSVFDDVGEIIVAEIDWESVSPLINDEGEMEILIRGSARTGDGGVSELVGAMASGG